MPNTKNIVCLANSRKPEGYCFAGKEVRDGNFGEWVRPISVRDGEEISELEQRFSDGDQPELLDVVAIPLREREHQSMGHQQENYLIHSVDDGGSPWRKVASVDASELPGLVDSISGDLWVNGHSSGNGNNDQVPVGDAENLDYSLLLIQPASLTIIVRWGGNYPGHRQVRADFDYNGDNYNLVVTDPVAEKKYLDKALSDFREDEQDLPREYHVAVDGVYLCISLGKEFEDRKCYKLVAAIIGDEI